MRMVTERIETQNVERDINVNIYIQLGPSENFVFNSAIHRKEHGISNINYNTLLLYVLCDGKHNHRVWNELGDNIFKWVRNRGKAIAQSHSEIEMEIDMNC